MILELKIFVLVLLCWVASGIVQFRGSKNLQCDSIICGNSAHSVDRVYGAVRNQRDRQGPRSHLHVLMQFDRGLAELEH